MTIPPAEQRYSLEPHARFRVLDDEGIFVLQESGEVVVVNKLGAFIVEQLRRDQSLDDIVRAISKQYEVTAAQAREDAEAMIDALVQAGALRPS